jgi:hypothetical protein
LSNAFEPGSNGLALLADICWFGKREHGAKPFHDHVAVGRFLSACSIACDVSITSR